MPLPEGYPPEVIEPQAGTADGCPALGRVRAYVADQGVAATLRHAVRGRDGRPADLSAYAGGSAVLRLRDLAVSASAQNPVVEVAGSVEDAAAGTVLAPLRAAQVARPGLYQLSFGVLDAGGALVKASAALLSVEPTLFGGGDDGPGVRLGPPSIGEVRMAVRDSAPNENLLLRDLEFGDDQIANAVVRPLRFWNEQPPPLEPFDTTNFPFREMWLRAVVAVLYETAAAGYRRNHLPYQAGGVAVDDQAKEKDYLAASQALWAEWREFVLAKKLEINHALFCGTVGSPYDYAWMR